MEFTDLIITKKDKVEKIINDYINNIYENSDKVISLRYDFIDELRYCKLKKRGIYTIDYKTFLKIYKSLKYRIKTEMGANKYLFMIYKLFRKYNIEHKDQIEWVEIRDNIRKCSALKEIISRRIRIADKITDYTHNEKTSFIEQQDVFMSIQCDIDIFHLNEHTLDSNKFFYNTNRVSLLFGMEKIFNTIDFKKDIIVLFRPSEM